MPVQLPVPDPTTDARLRAFVRRRLTPSLRSVGDSVDVLQSAAVRFLRSPKGGEVSADPAYGRLYLVGVIRNVLRERAKRAAREARPVPEDRLRQLPGDDPTPSAALGRREEEAAARDRFERYARGKRGGSEKIVRLLAAGMNPQAVALVLRRDPAHVRRVRVEMLRRLAQGTAP